MLSRFHLVQSEYGRYSGVSDALGRMALGTCNHLWLKRHLTSTELAKINESELPKVTRGHVEAYRIGNWTLLAAEREPALVRLDQSDIAEKWLYLDLEPDHDHCFQIHVAPKTGV